MKKRQILLAVMASMLLTAIVSGRTIIKADAQETETTTITETETTTVTETETTTKPETTTEQETTTVVETETTTGTDTPVEPPKDNVPYTVEGTVIKLNVVQGKSIAPTINEAITHAGKLYAETGVIHTVKIPAGFYKIGSVVRLYGNIILDCTDVKLMHTSTKSNMLFMADSNYYKDPEKMGGYGTMGNITVIGGTWLGNNENTASMVKLFHTFNVTFEGCTFMEGGCTHQLEIAAIDGFTLKNCVFKDSKGKKDSGKHEAVQFDIPCDESLYKNVVQDGTPMKNVLVEDCSFINLRRGVGTHSMLLGAYHENMTFRNNVFSNIKGECIVALNYKNCNIEGNAINNCGAGIIIQNFKNTTDTVFTTTDTGNKPYTEPVQYDMNTSIKNNYISIIDDAAADVTAGIRVCGYVLAKDYTHGNNFVPAGNYYIEGVNVTDNIINTTGWGIDIQDARKCNVSGNFITGKTGVSQSDGIFVHAGSQDINIYENMIKNAGRAGINVVEGAIVKEIKDNNISKPKTIGISLYNSNGSGNILNNTVSGAGESAIMVSSKSKIAGIKGNVIKNNSGKGICIHLSAEVTGEISGNNISGSGSTAISLYSEGKVKNIVSNNISSAVTAGIALTDKSTVTSAISKNTLSDVNGYGIYIESLSNALNIDYNNIKKCDSEPLRISQIPSDKKLVIENNNFTANTKVPVLNADAGKLYVRKNTLSGGKNAGYFAAGVTAQVENNTLKSNKSNNYVVVDKNKKTINANETAAATVSKLTSPKKKKAELTFKKVENAAKYIIQYGTDKKFAKPSAKTVKSAGKYSFRNLKRQKTYYFRIQVIKKINGVTITQNIGGTKSLKIK